MNWNDGRLKSDKKLCFARICPFSQIRLHISTGINEHNRGYFRRTYSHLLPPAHKQMPRQDLCSLCKLVVSFLQPYVDNNSTEVRTALIHQGLGFPACFTFRSLCTHVFIFLGFSNLSKKMLLHPAASLSE